MPHAVRLFDLALARRLLALDGPGLAGWLDEHLGALKARTRRGVASWLEAMRTELPPELVGALPPLESLVAHWDDLAAALREAADPADLALAAAAIAEKAAFDERRIVLDPAGWLAVVFGPRPPSGALSNRAVFADEGPERYLLLGPEPVEVVVEALRRRPAGGAMADADVEALAALAARCREDRGLRVAFLLDG